MFRKLSFRTIAALLSALVCFAVFAASMFLSSFAVRKYVSAAEEVAAIDKAEAVRRYLTFLLPRSLEDVARDYSEWDPIYRACLGEQQLLGKPTDKWLNDELIWLVRKPRVNGKPLTGIVLWSSQNGVIYSAGSSPPSWNILARQAATSNQPVTGIFAESGKLYLASAFPVRQTGGKGPPTGAFVFFQVFDPRMVAETEEFLDCRLSFGDWGSLDPTRLPPAQEWHRRKNAEVALLFSEGRALVRLPVPTVANSTISKIVVERQSAALSLAKRGSVATFPISSAVAFAVFLVTWAASSAAVRPVVVLGKKLREMEATGRLQPLDKINGPREIYEMVYFFDRAVRSAEEAAEREKEALRRLAEEDLVTGLANRRKFLTELQATIEEAVPAGKHVAVVFADLNGLKAVNDQIGHAAGDERLKAFAEALKAACAAFGAFPARLEGDEFVLFVRGEREKAEAIVAALTAILEAKGLPGDEILGGVPAFEWAIVVVPNDGTSFNELLVKADDIIKEKKGGGAAGQVRRALISLSNGAPSEMVALKLLLLAADAHDRYTLGHSERVSALTKKVARKLGFCEDKAERIALAGLFHDVGRVFMSQDILTKTDDLTPNEREEVEAHAAKGAAILYTCSGMSDIAAWVRAHHERLDGSGYPDGLKGGEIPIEARILAVADAWDAATSPKLHGKAKPPGEVACELLADPGLDREVVRALLQVVGIGL